MIIIGFLVAMPLIVPLFFHADTKYVYSFIIPSFASVFLGFLICFLLNDESSKSLEWKTSIQSSSLTALFAWVWGTIVGAAPFIFSNQLTLLQAVFESVSGWTTTGLSVMDVSKTPKIFLFHRSFIQFCGGLGFVMMIVMLISRKQAMTLYNAEGHPDKLMLNLKRTGRIILLMYCSFLILGSLLYIIARINIFDAILHTMCALSIGGFSTQLNSIGEYNNILIEIITLFLMLIGTTNFAVLLFLVKRKWLQVIRVSEVKFMFLLLIIFVHLTAISLSKELDINMGESFRKALFDVSSALSTTGYSSMSYRSWLPFSIGILILMMLIGGGMGSAAGGIKISRIYIMFRLAFLNVRKRFSPLSKIESPYYFKAQGKTDIDYSLALDIIGFIVFYLLIFIIGTMLITLTSGCNLTDAMFEFASALGTVGLLIGITSPTTNSGTLIIEIFGMLLGRLEIFIVFIGIYSGILKLKQKVKNICLLMLF